MLALVLKLTLAPVLVLTATAAAGRWGNRVGGVVSAFPAIVGPLLLVTLIEHGASAVVRAADGTLLGLAGLSGFAAAYVKASQRHGWPVSLASGWLAAAFLTGAAELVGRHVDPGLDGALAAGSILLALLVIGRPPAHMAAGTPARGWRGIVLRAVTTSLLVALLAAAVGRLGPTTGGLLAALPVLASVLATFAHRETGAAGAVDVLRGTVIGMFGFAAFCQAVALTIVPYGAPTAFVLATLCALLLQVLAARRSPAARNSKASRRPALVFESARAPAAGGE